MKNPLYSTLRDHSVKRNRQNFFRRASSSLRFDGFAHWIVASLASPRRRCRRAHALRPRVRFLTPPVPCGPQVSTDVKNIFNKFRSAVVRSAGANAHFEPAQLRTLRLDTRPRPTRSLPRPHRSRGPNPTPLRSRARDCCAQDGLGLEDKAQRPPSRLGRERARRAAEVARAAAI